MTSTPLVEIVGVSKSFAARRVLDDVSLELAPAQSTVVVGPSGCGKTTLLRLIAGLESADAGEIRIAGVTATAAGRIAVAPHRRGIGFVFQDLALWPHMTIAASLGFVLESARVERAEREGRIREALTTVHLAGLGERYPHQLSGGEQQRAALARALIARPRLILLDEPLSSLDADLREAMRRELSALRASRMTIVHVTHDRNEARMLADRLVEMRQGRIVSIEDVRPGGRQP